MAKKDADAWVSAGEAAKILTANTDHEISIDYVRLLAKSHKIKYRARNMRENEYLRADCEAYHVRPQNTPRIRPRASTRKATAKDEGQEQEKKGAVA